MHTLHLCAFLGLSKLGRGRICSLFARWQHEGMLPSSRHLEGIPKCEEISLTLLSDALLKQFGNYVEKIATEGAKLSDTHQNIKIISLKLQNKTQT